MRPTASRNAEAAPTAGQGEGSTRWYGWFDRASAIVLVSINFAPACPRSTAARPAVRHGLGRFANRIHGVGQRDRVEVVVVGIPGELRIDEEHHGHLATLAGFEPLLGEAETVDLGKILA